MEEKVAAPYLANTVVGGFPACEEQWRTARGHHPGVRDLDVDMQDIPSEAEPYLEEVQATQVFQQFLGSATTEFKMVEIKNLVAFQAFVDCDFAESSPDRSLLDEVKACIPTEFTANYSINHVAHNTVLVSSMTRSLSIASCGFNPASGTMGFQLAAMPNWVQVVRHDGRCVLKNGYHRTWRRLQTGETHVPAIVVDSPEYRAAPRGVFADLLYSEQPPLFGDFADKNISPELEMKSMMKIIRFSAEEYSVSRLP